MQCLCYESDQWRRRERDSMSMLEHHILKRLVLDFMKIAMDMDMAYQLLGNSQSKNISQLCC